MATMPRVLQYAPLSAGVVNTYAQELDDLSKVCKVRRSSPISLLANTDTTITWQVEDFPTGAGGDMWDPVSPDYVVIRARGLYSIELHLRFEHATFVAPYSTGERAGKIMIDGTNAITNSRATAKQAASVTGEGVSLTITAMEALEIGQRVYGNCWSSTGPIASLQQNFGGTYMVVRRTAQIP